MQKAFKCETCQDTGWYGDNGPGIKGNNEYQRCECKCTPTGTHPCPGCQELQAELQAAVAESAV